ncbi:hypothetical protein CNYM01_00111 [Colletotrichum nymphaeae SA-01]|uniref:Uncharacterized protein n=1 Tax=Colletotrichum nymphaeae SA-01 TaxID=1460502 RepID=A0A135UJR5_9PEZI|nr:hypothetical protein CNYM01_00111 [Colletotrichum nymphaeae SA-01]
MLRSKGAHLVHLSDTPGFPRLDITVPIPRPDCDNEEICTISDRLGACITSEKSPDKEGTKVLFVMTATKTMEPSMHLMTCQRVCLGEASTIDYTNARMSSHPVLQPWNKTLRDDPSSLEIMSSKWKLKDNMDLEVQQHRLNALQASARSAR